MPNELHQTTFAFKQSDITELTLLFAIYHMYRHNFCFAPTDLQQREEQACAHARIPPLHFH